MSKEIGNAAVLGLATVCIAAMNYGAFSGGGRSPQAFAVLVALVFLGVVAVLLSGGGKAFGGKKALLGSVFAAVVVAVVFIFAASRMEFPEWGFPVLGVLGLVSGGAGAALFSERDTEKTAD